MGTLTAHLSPEQRKKLELLMNGDPSKKDKTSTLSLKQKKPEQQKRDHKSYIKKIKAVQEWLAATWPQLFDLKNPKPLKRRIEADIAAHLIEPFTKTQLRKALQAYTNRNGYLKAVLNESWRYDLNGQPVEEILEIQKAYTEEKKNIKDKRIKRS